MSGNKFKDDDLNFSTELVLSVVLSQIERLDCIVSQVFNHLGSYKYDINGVGNDNYISATAVGVFSNEVDNACDLSEKAFVRLNYAADHLAIRGKVGFLGRKKAEIDQEIGLMKKMLDPILLSEHKKAIIAGNDGSTDRHNETISTRDKAFIQELKAYVSERYNDSTLNAGKISQYLAISERQLQRKIRTLLGKSVPAYIRSYRLQEGAKLICQGCQISEAAYTVGFSSAHYFSRCFKAYFGITPKVYRSTRQ